jgi:hypothetical protein
MCKISGMANVFIKGKESDGIITDNIANTKDVCPIRKLVLCILTPNRNISNEVAIK